MTERSLNDSGIHETEDAAPQIASRRDLMILSLAALGVVFGDIGTSPLYTIKECFGPVHGVAPTAAKVLHEQVILFYVVTENVPQVPPEEQVRVHELGDGFYSVVARCGFAETPNVPRLIKQCRSRGLTVKLADTSYYLGRETLLTSGKTRMSGWRKALFTFLSRNARPATAFFGLPPNRVVELGMQVQL